MAGRTERSPFAVEWINVTYRSVGVILLILGLAAGGGAYWYHSQYRAPEGAAQAAIARAESRLFEAKGLAEDPALAEIVGKAESTLEVARRELASAAYREASISAIWSENLSLQAISKQEGEESRLGAQFSMVEGDVRIKQVGAFSWKNATAGMVLHVGDQVKTSSRGSAEVLYFDGTATKVEPGSLLEIRDLYEDPVTKVRRVREKLTWGAVRASTPKRNVNGSYHEVATETVAARSDNQGEFRVSFDREKGTSVVDVFDGRVKLATSSSTTNVAAGERVRARADGTLLDRELLPGVPRLLLPSDQRVFVFESPAEEELALRWEMLPNIERYRLMISARPLFTEALYDAERTGGQALIKIEVAGSYHWKVAAISNDGITGPFSATRRFRVSSQRIHDRSDTQPPTLELSEFVLVGQMVIVSGKTEPDATLWIDNNKVDVDEDGTFNAVVKLRKEGLNEMLIVAQDAAGNEESVTRQAYVEVY